MYIIIITVSWQGPWGPSSVTKDGGILIFENFNNTVLRYFLPITFHYSLPFLLCVCICVIKVCTLTIPYFQGGITTVNTQMWSTSQLIPQACKPAMSTQNMCIIQSNTYIFGTLEIRSDGKSHLCAIVLLAKILPHLMSTLSTIGWLAVDYGITEYFPVGVFAAVGQVGVSQSFTYSICNPIHLVLTDLIYLIRI
jgi:hypothetical protein